MKLIVQIPCFNEEATLARTVADIPRAIDGVGEVEVLIVDDGSTDGTVEAARAAGVDHIVRHTGNKGLARSFRTGIDACLRLGADIIVNTDGDNQYAGRDIPRLIAPILEGRAEVVVGDRRTDTIAHFSPLKRLLQRLGSAFVRRLSGTTVPDTVSGFRAMTREAALQLNILSPFSYTIEMLIQAGNKKMAVVAVPVDTNPVTRPSRLFTSIPHFLKRSAVTMVRMYAMYRPLRVFFAIGTVLTVAGAIPVLRFLYFYVFDSGTGHVQSLVLGGVLLIIGFITYLIGMIADLISFNRQLVELTLQKVTRIELALQRQSGKSPIDIEAVRRELEEIVERHA